MLKKICQDYGEFGTMESKITKIWTKNIGKKTGKYLLGYQVIQVIT